MNYKGGVQNSNSECKTNRMRNDEWQWGEGDCKTRAEDSPPLGRHSYMYQGEEYVPNAYLGFKENFKMS